MNFPVFDFHCDTSLALLGKSLRECGSLLKNDGHVDLERAKRLPGFAQCFGCYTSTVGGEAKRISPTELFEREMVSILREVESNQDLIRLCYNGNQIEDNQSKGLMSAVLTIEGPAGFGFDPGLLEDLYNVGFRVTTLCWNESNPLTGSHKTGGGLTEQGKAYVREAQRLGMIVDVSHISDEAFWQIMDITTAPVVASHSNSRAVHMHSRNLTDEMFLAICKTNGAAGLNMFTEFVGGSEDLDALRSHAEHYLMLDPDGTHIMLGGDLDGCDTLIAGFEGVQSYPLFARNLLDHGIDSRTVRNIFWNNAVGVMKRCCI